MSHIEKDGESYCDWRLSVEDCLGGDFFWVLHCLDVSLCVLNLLCCFSSLSIRRFSFGESIALIPKGENELIVFVCLINITFLLHSLSVLGKWPDLASGVLWAFAVPLNNITMAFHFFFLRKLLPKTNLLQEPSKWSPTSSGFSKYIIAFSLLLFVTHVVIISVAQSFLADGQITRGRQLEEIGLAITCFSYLFLVLGLGHTCLSLRNKILAVMRENRSIFPEGGNDTTLLSMTAAKLQEQFGMITFIGTMEILYFMPLAFYHGFFTNLPFSKAMAIITMVIFPLSGAVHTFSTLIFDIKKWLHKRSVKEKSSTDSKKGETSTSGNHRIQQIIEDLKPKEVSAQEFSGEPIPL